jgi:hypothetical protein
MELSIVVTIPKNRINQVEAEEADVARRMEAGEKDIIYWWSIPTEPVNRVERIYFVWDGAVRAWHEIIEINHENGVRVYMKPEIHTLKDPIPMKGFQGWRYFEVAV